MLSNPQKALLKRAQREAGLSDEDYREALETIAGVRSSTAPALTDRHLDKLLAYFEAIHWREVTAGRQQVSCSPNAVFRQKGFWAGKNCAGNTSRDRHVDTKLAVEISEMESLVAFLKGGECGPGYFATIRQKVTKGRDDARSLHQYLTALRRTAGMYAPV